MAYAIVRTDRMHGTDNAADLVSIKYIVTTGSGDSAVSTETAIENGNVLKVGALMEGEREIFAGSAPAANDDLDDIVLIATPEVIYDEHKNSLDQFINEAGRPCRGYHLRKADIFSVTKDALDGVATPAVGNVVELKAGTKLNVAASATSGSTVVGKILDIETRGGITFYAVLVG